MKTTIAVALLGVLLAGCGGAPEPIQWAELEAMDQRFVALSRGSGKALADDVLKKEELTLADVLAIADLLNPDLEVQRRGVDVATAMIWDARLYPNPSAILEFEDYRPKDGATIGKMKRVAGLLVPIVVSGRLGAATSLAEKERELAAMNYVWRRREILSEVKRAFVNLLVTRQSSALARETRDLAKTFHGVTEERFRAQAVPEMEVLKSGIALARAETDVKMADKQQALTLKSLHALMGNVDFPISKFSGEIPAGFALPALEGLRGHVAGSHPLMEAARKGKEAAELELSLARSERWSDLEATVLAGRSPEGDTIVEGGVSIPIPIFNRNQGKIARAEARIRQAESQIDATRNELVLRLTQAHRNLSAELERVTAYRDDILPKAEKAAAQTNEGYRSGKFGYLDLLDAQRTLAEARIAYSVALAELNLSAVELEKVTGVRIEPVR